MSNKPKNGGVLLNYLSNLAVPFVIMIILYYGIRERVSIFDAFLDGAKEGIEMVLKIFPTLIGLFVAIGVLRSSGILNIIINIMSPITSIFKIPKEILPLAILRPISGSSALAVGVDIMKQYGVDSKIGLITATIMGSTETTIYTIAVYTSVVKIKKTRFVLFAALMGDLLGMLISVEIWRFLS